ncbi:DUF4105 domain-containing protein [Maribacter algicola]|uniref:DUF4105 domain-containing protein n=1 Tax=Meishania litoralis TaxID=3434685 RepID=A0ACC7LEK9_9FLAO
MPFKKLLFLLCTVATLFGSAQIPELSPLSKISVLTSGPGDVLYSAFGHSAFRVQDPTLAIDVVYNYGVFDTSGENFYWKFSLGRMDYKLVRQRFGPYLQSYKFENRWVKEQLLNLSHTERNELFKFLENNNLPENKVYSYDYFSNNCATKIWDVLQEVLGEKLVFKEDYIDQRYSFRELIHHNINTNSWGAFGIDVALGSVIDRKATAKEHMYLPIYIYYQLNAAQLKGLPLVSNTTTLFDSDTEKNGPGFFATPLFLFLIIAILILVITYSDFKKRKRSRALDVFILLLTGLSGVVLFFLWFLTDHIWTVQNYNIFWAFPLNVFMAFVMLRRSPPRWTGNYFLLLLALQAAMLLFGIFRIQYFSPVLLPLFLALGVRYFYLWYSSKNFKILSK